MNISNTKIEQRKSLLPKLKNNYYHKFDTYTCPFCSTLPEILYFNEGNNTIKIKCKKHGENILETQDYLEKMSNWQRTSEIELKNKCNIHNLQFSYYCKNCEENICQKCLKNINIHDNHIKYEIDSLRPNNTEISLIYERINIFLQKKDELIRTIKILDDKITFYDTLIYTYERQNPNYLLYINLKHLLHGEKLNFESIKNIEFSYEQSKKEIFDDFVKNNFIDATLGLNKLNLKEKYMGNELLEDLVKGIDNNSVFRTLKFGGKIQGPKEVIVLKNIKYLILRSNQLSSLNFIMGKDFPFLEVLSLNDNELVSIDELKTVSFPSLRELYLSKNKIMNIDILSSLNIRNLEVLWLSHNNITSINVLEKVYFPQLIKLGLNKNKIKNINVFGKNKTKFPQLLELYLNDNEINKESFSEIIMHLYKTIEEFYI